MSSPSYEDREENGYMSWAFKRQRPDKLPGLQEVWRLPELPEGQTCCEEGQQCFYFSCSKCASKLALDCLNPGYETSMQYIPRISCIPWPEPFKEDNKYHGEIYEMYLNYFAQMNPPIKGVAINGWGNTNAANLFHNIAETFKGTGKFEKSKDFEIDWILLNGSTITVIEVKEKSETAKGKKKNFETKIDQIKKDKVIMQHLMEVTGTEKTRVNYVIACPNVSIQEVTDGNLLRNHSQFLQDIEDAGDTISFISEECFAQRHVYKYDGDSKELEGIDFKVLINEQTDTNSTVDPVIHPAWDEQYKHLSATLVLSLLIIGNVIDDKNRHLYPRAEYFELRQRCSRKLQSIPFDARENFPECLVLGPDQLDIIREINRSKSGKFIICGEAGCGKSFVLLYLLYQHTAKGLSECQLKKVNFLIPQRKTEFRKLVKTFVDNYCHDHLVDIRDSQEADHSNLANVSECDLTFVDETYSDLFTGCSDLSVLKSSNKYVISVGFREHPYISDGGSRTPWGMLEDNFKMFHLRKRYRNPANISYQCSKLYKEQRDPMAFFINIMYYLMFTCINDGGVSVTADDSFKILKFDKEETIFSHFDEISCEMFSGETVLLVTDMSDICSSSFAKEKCTHVELCQETTEESSDDDWTTELQFTGVQYHSVICVFDRQSYIEKDISLLYQAISRAICRVIIICHENLFDYFHKLLTPDEADVQVLGRLRESKSVRLEDFQLLTDENQWEIALYLIILTKNIKNFETTRNLVIQRIGFKNVADALIRSFPWGEEGEIVRMIDSLNTQIQLTSGIERSLFDASTLLSLLPNKQKRLLLWQRLKQTVIFDDTGFSKAHFSSLFNARRSFCLRRIELSLIWHDEELYETSTREMTSFLVACSHHLSQCFDALPSPMKKKMDCTSFIDKVEIFPESQMLRDHFVQKEQKLVSREDFELMTEDFIQSTLSDIYTGSSENLKTFFMGIWKFLLDDPRYKGFRNTEWTKIELEIISSLDDICKQKTIEAGSTDMNVALETSRAVSDVRVNVVPRC